MLLLLSPAKSLDLDSPVRSGLHATQPRLLEQTQELVDIMVTKSPADLARLMHISDELAELNAQRYADFEFPFTRRNARPALWTFAGDVYVGLDAPHRFDARDLTEAGKTLRILSGLYGLLRPLDLMQPYRLEMGTPLANPRGKDLYAYWRPMLTELVRADAEASPGADVVVNLASAEYAGAVDLDALGLPVVSPRFEDQNPKGEWKVMSFDAKRARGMMAGWLVQQRARTAKAITRFDDGGYRFSPERSTPEVPVFRRRREDRS